MLQASTKADLTRKNMSLLKIISIAYAPWRYRNPTIFIEKVIFFFFVGNIQRIMPAFARKLYSLWFESDGDPWELDNDKSSSAIILITGSFSRNTHVI